MTLFMSLFSYRNCQKQDQTDCPIKKMLRAPCRQLVCIASSDNDEMMTTAVPEIATKKMSTQAPKLLSERSEDSVNPTSTIGSAVVSGVKNRTAAATAVLGNVLVEGTSTTMISDTETSANGVLNRASTTSTTTAPISGITTSANVMMNSTSVAAVAAVTTMPISDITTSANVVSDSDSTTVATTTAPISDITTSDNVALKHASTTTTATATPISGVTASANAVFRLDSATVATTTPIFNENENSQSSTEKSANDRIYSGIFISHDAEMKFCKKNRINCNNLPKLDALLRGKHVEYGKKKNYASEYFINIIAEEYMCENFRICEKREKSAEMENEKEKKKEKRQNKEDKESINKLENRKTNAILPEWEVAISIAIVACFVIIILALALAHCCRQDSEQGREAQEMLPMTAK